MISLHPTTKKVFITNVVLIVVTSIFLLLRLSAGFFTRSFSFLSDGLCIFSYILFCAYTGSMLYYVVDVANGGPFQPNDQDVFKKFLKILYAIQIIFMFSVSIIKFSILAFYRSLFGVEDKVRRIIDIVTAGCALWFVGFTLLAAFRCRPPHLSWSASTEEVHDHCLPFPSVYLPMEATNLLSDFVILAIPVFTIGKLNLSRRKRLSVLGIFLVGATVCVTSVARLIYIAEGNHAEMFVWSCTQLALSFICSCLPMLGPILNIGKRRLSSHSRSNYASFPGVDRPNHMGDAHPRPEGHWVDLAKNNPAFKAHVWRGDDGSPDSDIELDGVPSRHIRVQKEVSIV